MVYFGLRITKTQKNFLTENSYCYSKLIRSLLDQFIEGQKSVPTPHIISNPSQSSDSKVSQMQLFFDVLKKLEHKEGQKNPVSEADLIIGLYQTELFTIEDARKYLRRMLREASVYESRPGHFNRV